MQLDVINQFLMRFLLSLVAKHGFDRLFLDSDLPGFMFDSLQGTSNEVVIR